MLFYEVGEQNEGENKVKKKMNKVKKKMNKARKKMIKVKKVNKEKKKSKVLLKDLLEL